MMASLTPGMLSKLLENAGNPKFKVRGEYRSALLQVIEIVPDDPFRTRGFFLKLSDSLHSAYVSISPQDLDLIFSDQIQLGQFVYVSRFDLGLATPVPVVSGLKVLPKRRPCVGTPKDLVSTDLLQLGSTKTVRKHDNKTKPLDSELSRLSLDSARRAWHHSPPTNITCSSPNPKPTSNNPSHIALSLSQKLLQLNSVKKDSSNSVSSIKRLSFSISPMTNKNDLLPPKTINMRSKEHLKSPTDRNIPGPHDLVKLPLNYKTRFNQRISWGVLPPAIQDLGKEAVCHGNVALLAAIRALEEASALEAVIYCLQAFSDLCNSSRKVSAGPLVEQFLDVHQSMQKAAEVINSLINRRISEAKSSTHGSLQTPPDVYNTLTSKNAVSWVHAAIETDLSKFSLFRKPEKSETVNDENYLVILESAPKFMKCENHSPVNKPNPGNHGSFSSDLRGKQATSLRKQLHPSTKKTNSERKEGCKGSKLKEAARLAEKLLLVSRQWFLKYLEDSLNLGFSLIMKGSSDIACLLRQLKRVNEWLGDLVRGEVEADDRIEDLRKKLYSFLLEHVDSAVLAGK